MEFLEDSQIAEWYADHGLPDAHVADRAAVIMRRPFGQCANPVGQESEVALLAIEALGEWQECLLWVRLWSVWPSSEDWPKYYAERAAQGERRSLEVAPGHLFRAGERALLGRFLQLVLENAWEAEAYAIMGGCSNGRRLFASHDEYIEVSALSTVPQPRAV